MAFCLPFSTALTLIFSAFGVLFGLVGFDWASLKIVICHPIAILCVALFAWLALSMLWSIAPRDEMIEGISKYRKLLYVPLVAMLLVSTRVKPWFLMNFFVAGCLVVCVGSLFSSSGLAGWVFGPHGGHGAGWFFGGTGQKAWFYLGPPEKPTFGRAHIAQGAFLVFSVVYLFGNLFKKAIEPQETLIFIHNWKALLLCSVLVFVSLNLGGLTGYVLLVAGFFIWMGYLAKSVKPLFLLTVLSIMVVAGFVSWKMNPSVNYRIQKSYSDLGAFVETGALTSEGLRLRYWKAGLKMGVERPIIGWGVGSYAERFSRDNTEPEVERLNRPHPHSELVLQLAQGGCISMALWILIFWTAYRHTEKSQQPMGCALAVVGMLVFIGGLFNSVVWDLAEGHFVSIILSALTANCIVAFGRNSSNKSRDHELKL